MLLCKIMLKQAAECDNIVQGKLALTYQGRPIEAILAVAESCKKANVINFKQQLQKYSAFKKFSPNAPIWTFLDKNDNISTPDQFF